MGLLALCAALLACETPVSTLHVDVETDLVPEFELALLQIEVLSGSGPAPSVVTASASRRLSRDEAASFVTLGVRVASFETLAPGTYTVRVVGRQAPETPGLPEDAGPALVQTRVLVALRPGASRVVRVILGARCAERMCPDGDEPELTACLNGRCVLPSCDVSAGEVCDDRASCVAGDPEGCAESPPPTCATVLCRDGACLNEPIPGACGDDEYCGRFGCEPVPGTTSADAGIPDAWVELPDAYEPPPPDASGPCGPLGTPCDDGNPCTGPDTCNATGCAGTPLTGPACGTRNTCRLDSCQAGVCMQRNATNGTPCGTRNACRNDGCQAGVCTRVNVGNGTACSDGDGNACTSGECATGACRPVRLADGSGCGSGNICCSGGCINPQSNGSHCGVCGVSCGGRGCHQGLCHCSTNSQCTGELGSAATCWDNDIGPGPTDGMHCQCQCASGTTCDACPGAARCRMESGYNHCFYP